MPTEFHTGKHPHLFQINTWVWLDQLSRAGGRTMHLADVPDSEWDRLKALGFDLVYLLGIWKRSLAGRRIFRTDPANFGGFDHALPGWTISNVVGSPFSIQDYVPDAHIGDWKQVDAVRRKLHDRGMGLILDFVPNHTGPDHVWIDSHPEYYVQGTEADYHAHPAAFILVEPEQGSPTFIARGRDPYFDPWTDTAQLNYFSPAAREALIGVLRHISEYCDGVRCDMAMLMLNDIFPRTWGNLLRGTATPKREFWEEAIAAVRAGFIWMAEVYWDLEARLQQLGFNYTYDKRLYDRLREQSGQSVRDHLSADINYQTRMARFLENHDEPRSVPTYGRQRIPSLAGMVSTLPGLRFFHQGQFEGRTLHIPMPLNAVQQEGADNELAKVYEKILAIANDRVFHDGDWRLLPVESSGGDSSCDNLVAYRWKTGDTFRVVVVNLSGATSQGRIHVEQELPAASKYVFADRFNGPEYLWQRADLLSGGLYVKLDPYGLHIFEVSAAESAGRG
ncbi:MAG: alpha-amylase [Acidobacteria bacterium]|nr:alpha-amylase [Acidobacteriota bacterium]